MFKLLALPIALWLGLGSTAVITQTGGHRHDAGQAPALQGASKAYADANAKMHNDMAIHYSENADVDFVRGMIPHHQGAIDMAKVVQRYGKDSELRKLAGEIIAAQEQEIAWMQRWLAIPSNALAAMVEHHDHGSGPLEPETAAGKGYVQANMTMHAAMDIAYSGDADVDFVRGMIPHHQGAIDMAKIVQERGSDPDVKTLAAEIIKAQEQEIAGMRGWLRERGH